MRFSPLCRNRPARPRFPVRIDLQPAAISITSDSELADTNPSVINAVELIRRLCRPVSVAVRIRVWLLLEFVELLFLLFIQEGAGLLVGLVASALHFVMARLLRQACVPQDALPLLLHSLEDRSDFGLLLGCQVKLLAQHFEVLFDCRQGGWPAVLAMILFFAMTGRCSGLLCD